MNRVALAPSAHDQGDLWFSFRIGPLLYAAPRGEVSDVLRDGDLTPVPGAAADVLGIRHLGGRIMAVLDGRRRLGWHDEPAADPDLARVVAFCLAGQLAGLRVDAVGAVMNISGAQVAPPAIGHGHPVGGPVTAVLSWQRASVALLDIGRLFRLNTETSDVA